MRNPNSIITVQQFTAKQYTVKFGYNSIHLAQADFDNIKIEYRGASVTLDPKRVDGRVWVKVTSPVFAEA